jgi:prevent-host-death family protein
MTRETANIAHARNALSSLINKVAYGNARVVLQSRGKAKAVLISTDDLAKLERFELEKESPEIRVRILTEARDLRRKIRRRRKKVLPDSALSLERLRKERNRGISSLS